MKNGDLVFMIQEHQNNCGNTFPKNAIGKIACDGIPDRDGDLSILFPKKRWNDYIPANKLALVPIDRITEASEKYKEAGTNIEHAIL